MADFVEYLRAYRAYVSANLGWGKAAYRDLKRSKPDSAVWVLNCRNASFRVRLDPNMAARMTKLKNKS
jgi:hypothetical protein